MALTGQEPAKDEASFAAALKGNAEVVLGLRDAMRQGNQDREVTTSQIVDPQEINTGAPVKATAVTENTVDQQRLAALMEEQAANRGG